ncbi:MAG TPA: hypothetical protein VJC16_02605 [Candidatus Nanoarchaeia archaeon]|nr:hypothetical protein [Candidatus Nanoarchaeia archaeon]
MVKQLLHPAEIETYYILPTIRRQLAVFMKETGMQQKQIASLLGIQEAAVSQYLSNKRGHSFDFKEDMLIEIRKSAAAITDGLSLIRETNRLLQLLRTSKVLCDIHRLYSQVPDACQPKETGCDEYRGVPDVPNARIRY